MVSLLLVFTLKVVRMKYMCHSTDPILHSNLLSYFYQSLYSWNKSKSYHSMN